MCQPCYRTRDNPNDTFHNTPMAGLQPNSHGDLLRNAAFISEDPEDDGESINEIYSQDASTCGIDLTKGMSDLNIGDLIKIIHMSVKPIIYPVVTKLDGLEKKFEGVFRKLEDLEATTTQNTAKIRKLEEESDENKETIDELSSEVKTLKNVILEQQKYLESVKRKDLSNNLTISGIPKGEMKVDNEIYTDTEEKVDCILTFIGCQNHKYDILPLKEVEGRERLFLKLKFKDIESTKTIVSKAKLLKNFTAARIYINRDEPLLSRKENNRLRKKKGDLIKAHGKDVVKIEKGKLYHNNTAVDKFDLSNQIF